MKIEFNKTLNKWEAREIVTIAGVKITMTGLGDTINEAIKDVMAKLKEAKAKA